MSRTRRKSLKEHDERLAVSHAKRKSPDAGGRRHRCTTCFLMYTEEEMTVDFDEEGRRLGMICGSCS